MIVTLRTNGCCPARPPGFPATRGFGNGSRTCSTSADGFLKKVTPTSRGPAATGIRKSTVDACAYMLFGAPSRCGPSVTSFTGSPSSVTSRSWFSRRPRVPVSSTRTSYSASRGNRCSM